jgi:hypothetical protein
MKVYNTQGKEQHLFPMEKFQSRFRGYFMDKDGNIFSTRGTGKLKQLMGSQQYGYQTRYFTLDGATFQQSYLTTNCKSHRDFGIETSVPTVTGIRTSTLPSKVQPGAVLTKLKATGAAITAERNHARTVDEALSSKGTMIASIVDGKFVFGTNPVIHTTEASLKSEMTRLAGLNPGVHFVAFKIAGSVVSGGVVWS